LRRIERRFPKFPLSALSDPRTRGVFLDWRDRIAEESGLRQADYAITVLARVLSWAKDRGLITVNPCERPGRLYEGGARIEKVWTEADEALFQARAPKHLHLPLLLGLWTGQREGDLLRLPWSSYDGTHIRLRQSKGGKRVTIPVGAPLRAALDAARRESPIILMTLRQTPWTEDGFRTSWGKASRKAGIIDLRFQDLRGSAVTRLARAGCTEAEIAAITGHSLRNVRSILEVHYLHLHPELAENAIAKLERRMVKGNEE
jgi:integrase